MRKRTLIGCRSELGGSPLASSIAVIPRDHISAWQESDMSQKDGFHSQTEAGNYLCSAGNKHVQSSYLWYWNFMDSILITEVRNVLMQKCKKNPQYHGRMLLYVSIGSPWNHTLTVWWPQAPSRKVCQQMCSSWSGCLSAVPPLRNLPASHRPALTRARWPLEETEKQKTITKITKQEQAANKINKKHQQISPTAWISSLFFYFLQLLTHTMHIQQIHQINTYEGCE